MFKKTMKFDDLDGNEVQQTFYFNYNKKEIAELLEFGRVMRFAPVPGVEYMPLEEMMTKLKTPVEESGLSNRENNEQAYRIFENLLLDAYGVKGDDNVSFDKSEELRHYWSTHLAFPELVFEFLGNEPLAAEFIEKCLPPRLVAQVKEEEARKAKQPSIEQTSAEAAERQKDPATRIEPGIEAAREAGVTPPAREDIITDGLTDEEILARKPMDLSKPQLMRAYEITNAKNQQS